MTRQEILARAARNGMCVVGSDGKGNYVCNACGETWRAERRKLWWPIRLQWGTSSAWFRWHGIEGFRPNARIEQRTVSQVFHFGRLKVCFGDFPTRRGQR